MEINSERLEVRELNIADITDLKAIFQDSNLMKYWQENLSEIEVFEWYEKQLKAYPESGFYALQNKNNREIVGIFGLIKKIDNKRYVFEIELAIMSKYQNRGFADEALDLFSDYLKRNEIKEVWMTIREDNEKCLNLAKKHGFKVISKEIITINEGKMMNYIYAKDLSNRFNI